MAAGEIEEIVVTGSRIRRDEFSSASPVQVIDMEMSTLAGLIDTSEILQGSTVAANSTQINNLLGGFVTNGGPGVNTLDLRGLGANKTLVLLNGRRLNPAGTRGTVAAVDLNTLPASVIKRVEILKDGASSVYGSDAVTGVVNIITRDDLDGFAGHFQTSVPNESGGEIYSADIAWGLSTDRANIVVGVEWFDRRSLAEGQRDWSTCLEENYIDPDTGEDISTVDPTTGEVKCWNSPANDYVVVQGSSNPESSFFHEFAGRWIRDDSVTCLPGETGCAPGWRIGSLAERKFDNERQRNADLIFSTKRVNFFSFGDIDISAPMGGDMNVYYEYMYNNRRTEQNGGPRQFAVRVDQSSLVAEAFSPFYDPVGGNFLDLPLLLPYDQDGRQEVDWTRALGGIKGGFGDTSWSWDIHYAYGRSNGSYGSTQMLVDRVTNMLDIVETSPGVYDCAINLDGNASGNFERGQCIPFNPYAEIGQINDFSPDVLDYMTSYEVGFTTYTQNVVDGYVTGDLFELPAGTVGAVLGFQWREEEIDDSPSSGAINGNLWGFTSSGITQGTEEVKEVYGEIEVPVLRDVTAFQDLTFSASGRWTDYKTVGDDTTYKLGLNWQIIDQFRLRSAFGTSFRAPALYESFLGGQTAFSSAGDPCTDWNLEPSSSNVYQNCQSEGVPLDHGGFTSTPTVITFGNAGRLVPETSESLTVGAIIDLDAIGISLAVDYFDFDVKDEITRFGPQSIIDQCYEGPTDEFRQPGTICDFIAPRNPVTQNISDINDSYFNINRIQVNGFDYTVRYDVTLANVDWTADFRASQIDTWERELFGGTVEDLNNTIGLPDWNAQFDLTARWNDWTFYYGLDWIGGQDSYEDEGEDPATSIFVLDTDDVFYHALSARYTADNWSCQLGVTNLTDEDPPLVSDICCPFNFAGAAFYSGYDLRGTSVFLNVEIEF
jgi:iron complex outermembrane receptor protein